MNAPVRGLVEELQRLLAILNEQGRFAASVLTDGMGLPIASAAESTMEKEGQAAVAALVQGVAGRIRERLNLSETDEVSFFDSSGRRLVCRLFTADGHEFVLAVMIHERGRPYRLVTNRAVRSARQALETRWR